MTYVTRVNDGYQIGNGAGVQAKGSNAPDGDGLSPRELLEAAVALCVTKSLITVLQRDGTDHGADAIRVEVTASKSEGVTNRFTTLDVRVRLPEHLEPAYRKKLLTIAERACTIGNTIRHGAAVVTEEI